MRPMPPPGVDTGPGVRWQAVPDDRWEVLTIATAGRCRRTTAGARCTARAVAALNRARGVDDRPRWWHYCADHLYGRWIEGGRVMGWRAVRLNRAGL